MRGSLGETCLSLPLNLLQAFFYEDRNDRSTLLPRSPPLEARRMVPVPGKARVDPADRSSAATRNTTALLPAGLYSQTKHFLCDCTWPVFRHALTQAPSGFRSRGTCSAHWHAPWMICGGASSRFLSSPLPNARVSRAACSSHVCRQGYGGTAPWATRCGP